jgi:flagellar protein FliO/FliZ
MGHYLLTTALALILVLGLAVATLYLMRRFAPSPGSGQVISIVESVVLEPRRSLHVIRVGHALLLIGSTEGGVALVARLDDSGVEVPDTPQAPRRRFVDLLTRRR